MVVHSDVLLPGIEGNRVDRWWLFSLLESIISRYGFSFLILQSIAYAGSYEIVFYIRAE